MSPLFHKDMKFVSEDKQNKQAINVQNLVGLPPPPHTHSHYLGIIYQTLHTGNQNERNLGASTACA